MGKGDYRYPLYLCDPSRRCIVRIRRMRIQTGQIGNDAFPPPQAFQRGGSMAGVGQEDPFPRQGRTAVVGSESRPWLLDDWRRRALSQALSHVRGVRRTGAVEWALATVSFEVGRAGSGR
jgi:hypothetical protein